MRKCPSRYLTSDGRVLRCTVPGDHDDDEMLIELNGQHNSNTRTRSWMNFDGVTWPANDPCAFDATCKTCEGHRIDPESYVPASRLTPSEADPCPTCEGTGVDETIPLRMVGPGSVLEGRGKATDKTLRKVIVTMLMPPLCAVQAVWHSDDWGKANRVIIDMCDIGKSWTVVRAVPPAHTEETP